MKIKNVSQKGLRKAESQVTQISKDKAAVYIVKTPAAPKTTAVLASKYGQSCHDVCSKTSCSPIRTIRSCQEIKQLFKISVNMPCRAHYGVDLPAVRKLLDNTEELHVPSPDLKSTNYCAGQYERSKRICECQKKESCESNSIKYNTTDKIHVGIAFPIAMKTEKYPRFLRVPPHTKLEESKVVVLGVKKSVEDPDFTDVLLVPQHHGPVTINFGPVEPGTDCRQQHIKLNVLPKLSSKDTPKYFTCSGMEHHVVAKDSSLSLNFIVTIHNPHNAIRARGGDQFLTAELNGKQQDGQGVEINIEAKIACIGDGKYNVTATVYDKIASPGLTLVLSYLGERIVSDSCKAIEKDIMESSNNLTLAGRMNALLKECPLLSASRSVLGGRWIGDQWVLGSCKWRTFTKEMATDCLKNKNILFAGDSHLREQFVSMISFMSQPRSIFETTKFQHDREYKLGNSTFSFWWTNSAFFAPPDKKKSNFKADIMYASLYLADFGSFYLGITEFVYAVDASVKALLHRYPHSRLIWQLPHALHPHKTHNDWFVMNGFEQQKQFRQELYAKLVQIPEYGHRFFIFDPWDMTSTRHGSSSDGNHYFQNGKRFGGPVVFSKVQIVLNLMCRQTRA